MLRNAIKHDLTRLDKLLLNPISVLGFILSGLLLATTAFGQEGNTPVSVTLSPFLVDEVTLDDGSTEERFSEAEVARPGQVIEYRLLVENQSLESLPAGSIVVTGPVPDVTTYIGDSATLASSVQVEFSADGGANFAALPIIVEGDEEILATPDMYNAVRWTLLSALAPQESLTFSYRVTVN